MESQPKDDIDIGGRRSGSTVDRHILIRFHHILIPPQFLPVSHCEAKGGKLTEKLLNKLIILDIGPTH